VVSWSDGVVAIADSVDGVPALSGAELRDRYWEAMRDVTFRLAKRRGNAIMIGPVELLRLGEPRVDAHAVEWPIQGGLLAGAAGGRWRVDVVEGRATASIDQFQPSLPRPLYSATHLQVHLLFTRLFLLRLRGRDNPPAVRASPRSRLDAATVDVAFCLTLNRVFSRRVRPLTGVALLAGYHLACWTVSGRTLGGTVLRQRVVSADGRPVTVPQAVLRLVTAPLSWVTQRPIHDEIAGTDVIVDGKEEGAASAAPSGRIDLTER
jgi:hypothetical protein